MTLSAPVEAPPAGAMAPESAGAGVLDPRLDYIATLTFASPRQGEEVLRTGMEMVRGAKLVNWEGFAPRLDAWRAIAPAAYYTQVRVGLQLVDRLGLATDEQIVDFCQAVQAFAATLVAEPVFAGRAQALRAAAELDAIAAQADIQVGFNVLKSDGPTIPAVRVHDLMTSAGLLLDADGRFRAVLPEGAELFSVGNMEATPFVEQAIPRTATRGVTMTLDVPRAPDDDATFREFTRFAHGAAKALDGQLVDELIEPFRRNAIPVYVVGLPAPWGQSNPFAVNPKAIPASKDELLPTVGPESFLSERVDIESTARFGNRASGDLVDSGFGPFALERLCRASHGQFLALRGDAGPRGVNARSWPPGTELRFDEKGVSKYAPDYISAAEYEKALLDNKAKAVLVEAAKAARFKLEGQPSTRFPKDADAKMAKKLSEAQQYAARNKQPIDNLHDLLLKGEADRAKLTSPRWQAEYDLAAGRVCAIKVRLDGYNSMIAALKRGKTFQRADSKAWVLEPADSYETDSGIKKLADKAKLYLERVAREHPGTPWAKMAEDELKHDLGWHWSESP